MELINGTKMESINEILDGISQGIFNFSKIRNNRFLFELKIF